MFLDTETENTTGIKDSPEAIRRGQRNGLIIISQFSYIENKIESELISCP